MWAFGWSGSLAFNSDAQGWNQPAAAGSTGAEKKKKKNKGGPEAPAATAEAAVGDPEPKKEEDLEKAAKKVDFSLTLVLQTLLPSCVMLSHLASILACICIVPLSRYPLS